MKKCRRKKSRQSKRYLQINFVSTSQKNCPPPPLAQGLDPPLDVTIFWATYTQKPTEIFNTTCDGHLYIMFCRKVDRLLSLGNLVPKQLKNLIINSSWTTAKWKISNDTWNVYFKNNVFRTNLQEDYKEALLDCFQIHCNLDC